MTASPSTLHETAHQAPLALELAKLHPSPLQTRRHLGNLDELAASIAAHGVLQTVTARPHPKRKGELEIVFGHRRCAAAKQAGLELVPGLVRELTDQQALELIIEENRQREDLSALEEAMAYQRLHQEHGVPYAEIAERIHASRSHVYGRLKLLELKAPKAVKALEDGTLPPQTAELVASVPMPLQKDYVDRLLPRWAGAGVVPYREARKLLRDHYVRTLVRVPWKLEDNELLPDVGPCTTCPKRTGTEPALAELLDESRPDVCTDPPCWRRKEAAAALQELRAARDAGKPVLSERAAARLFYKPSERAHRDGEPAQLKADAPWVDLDESIYDGQKTRTRRAILGKAADELEPTLAVDPASKLRKLVPRAAWRAAAKAVGRDPNGQKLEKTKRKRDDSPAAKRERSRAKQQAAQAKVEEAVDEGLRAAIADGFAAGSITVRSAQTLAAAVVREIGWEATPVASRRGLLPKGARRGYMGPDPVKPLLAWLEKQRTTQAPLGLAAELLALRDEETLAACAMDLGLDRKDRVRKAWAYLKAIAPPKGKAKTSKAKGKQRSGTCPDPLGHMGIAPRKKAARRKKTSATRKTRARRRSS